MNSCTEALLWLALCLSPDRQVAWVDPLHGTAYTVSHWRRDEFFIHYGLDYKTYGPDEQFDWLVVKYSHDPFQPLKPIVRTVSHHDDAGYLKPAAWWP